MTVRKDTPGAAPPEGICALSTDSRAHAIPLSVLRGLMTIVGS